MFLSKHYKEKLWTNHERESAQARAFSDNREYILPARFDDTEIPGVLPTIGYIDLNKYSPKEFAELIKQKLEGFDRPKDEIVQEKAGPQAKDPTPVRASPLALIISMEGKSLIVETRRIELGTNIKLILLPADAREAAFLAGIRNSRQKQIMIAFGMTALIAQVETILQILEGTDEVWNVELQRVGNEFGSSITSWEMAYNSYTAEDIAELRARRILLNEKLFNSTSSAERPVALNDTMLEVLVRGNSPIIVEVSPFLELYSVAKGNIAEFLGAAKLYAIAWLILSGTVEYIHELELQMEGEAKLAVKFEGQRARRAINVPSHMIKVEGICNLVAD